MKKHEWVLVLFPLVLTWSIDQVSKFFASGIDAPHSWGYLNFVLHHNHGAMLGLFSDLPSVLRIVSLSTGGAFLICIFALIQFLLPIKSLTLRAGMSILLGGIIGNVTDRIIYGYVIDFVVLGKLGSSFSSPAFNLADALQWLGYAMVFYALIREGEILWPEQNARKKYWVNTRFQLKFCFILMGVGTGLALITGVFSYTYLKVTIDTLVGRNEYLANKYLVPYTITYTIISIAVAGILFAIGRFISHKTAGPIYAFEKFLDDIMGGNDRELKLRSGDDFKHLEEVADKLREFVRVNQESLPSQQTEDEQDSTSTPAKLASST